MSVLLLDEIGVSNLSVNVPDNLRANNAPTATTTDDDDNHCADANAADDRSG